MSIGCPKDATQEDKIAEYYNKIRDNVPLIEELDDEAVTPSFFDNKIQSISPHTKR